MDTAGVCIKLVRAGLIFYEEEHLRAVWFNEVLTFSDGQNHCWRVLWQNLLKGNRTLSQERVLRGWYGTTLYLADIFKRHEAWKTIIVGDGKGNFWLSIPADSESLSPDVATQAQRAP